jgi:hypothetical protein
MIVRFRLDDEAITLQTNAFHAMPKAKYSKAGIHPATFKLADLWGSQGLQAIDFYPQVLSPPAPGSHEL